MVRDSRQIEDLKQLYFSSQSDVTVTLNRPNRNGAISAAKSEEVRMRPVRTADSEARSASGEHCDGFRRIHV